MIAESKVTGRLGCASIERGRLHHIATRERFPRLGFGRVRASGACVRGERFGAHLRRRVLCAEREPSPIRGELLIGETLRQLPARDGVPARREERAHDQWRRHLDSLRMRPVAIQHPREGAEGGLLLFAIQATVERVVESEHRLGAQRGDGFDALTLHDLLYDRGDRLASGRERFFALPFGDFGAALLPHQRTQAIARVTRAHTRGELPIALLDGIESARRKDQLRRTRGHHRLRKREQQARAARCAHCDDQPRSR